MTSSHQSNNKRATDEACFVEVGARLVAAAEYVAARFDYEGNIPLVCADVGADHAYLSIYLAESLICEKIYATEINLEPSRKAVRNIASRRAILRSDGNGGFKTVPLTDIIEVCNVDGLDTISEKGINRAVICGMGGEVISGIIDRADFLKRDRVKLVLQPMSRELELRRYLSENGFAITDERLVSDSGRVYAIMSAVWDGKEHNLSPSELIMGKKIIESGGELFRELLARKYGHAKNKLSGRLHDKCADDFDRRLYDELKQLCLREDMTV